MVQHDFFNEEPRVTRAGRVSAGPYPYLALLAEADGRYKQLVSYEGERDEDKVIASGDTAAIKAYMKWVKLRGECHGIAVAISAIHADSLEQVSALVHERYVARLNGLPIPEYVEARREQYI